MIRSKDALMRRALPHRLAAILVLLCGLASILEIWQPIAGVISIAAAIALWFLLPSEKLAKAAEKQRAIEDDLRLSDTRFRYAVKATNDAIWDWNFETNHVAWNDALYDTFGYSAGQVESTGQWWIEHIHPDDRERVSHGIHEAIEGTASHWADRYRFLRGDGAYASVYDRGYIVRDEKGAPLRMLGAMQDLTALTAMTERLEENRKRFEQVLSSVEVGLWYCDLPFDELIWDVRVKEHFFLAPDARVTIGLFYERIHPDDREATRRAIETSITEHTGYDIEYRTTHPSDGTFKWIRAIGSTSYDEAGQPTRFDGLTLDVTERKNIDIALVTSEERFRSLAASVPQIVWTAQSDGSRDFYNDRWFSYTGLDRSDAHEWQGVVHPTDVPRIEGEMSSAMADGREWTSEYRLRRSDGEYRWHLGRRVPVRGADGSIVRWVGTATDIDDQKRFSELLERRVEERTAALTAANKELESFSYSISHDLRAPLRGIDGFSRMLESKYGSLLPEQGLEYLRRTRAAASRMGTLIDDMLQLSRLTRREMRRESVNLSSLVQEIAFELKAKEPMRSVRFEIESDVVAFGDSSLLRAVLDNLIGNAWKFTAKTSMPIIKFGSRTIGTEEVFFVEDNGAGFDMAYADKLFGAFQRLHGVDEFEGSGIGLATVQRVIQRHGGRVWGEGAVERGATFYFTLDPLTHEGDRAWLASKTNTSSSSKTTRTTLI